jgi:hypothetical protein
VGRALEVLGIEIGDLPRWNGLRQSLTAAAGEDGA